MSRCPKCEKQTRKERAEAKARGELGQGKPDRNGRLVEYSEEERQRRSELAKKLHAQGRLGGPAIGRSGGLAINRHRVSDAVMEHFRQPDQQALIIKAFESNLKGKNKTARMTAANSILRLEKEIEDRMRADRGGAVDPSGMTQEELQAFVEQGIQAMLERGEFPADVTLSDDDVQEIT